MAASMEAAERVASKTSKYATVMATLHERDEQLWQKELECAELPRSLATEKNLHAKVELEFTALRIDINNEQSIMVGQIEYV